MGNEYELDASHDGRVIISTFSLARSWKISMLLMFRYGFLRFGLYLPPIADDAIHLDYVRVGTRILAGWDNWSGYYFLAASEKSDEFLRRFFQRHCQ
jgi:hypothetical protein